jgi:foldase protein PrsA
LIHKTKPTIQQKSPIVALVGGKAIRRNDLWPALVEIAGEEVIEDAVNHLLLTEELKRKSIAITQKNIENERELLWGAAPSVDQDVFDDMLKEIGLGSFRQQQLLWRNAALRTLIASDVHVTLEAIKRMYEIVYGPSFPAKIIVCSTLDETTNNYEKLIAGETFSTVAIEHSIDPSAQQGGVVTPISPADPIWPAPIREALTTLKIDDFSDPIFIGDRWVIVLRTGEATSYSFTFEEVKDEVTKLATLAQERFLMKAKLEELREQEIPNYFDKDIERVLETGF